MVRLYSIGRFMGPWLAYTALSGLAVAFVLGAIATICGLVGGFFMVAGAGSIGNAISEVAKAFPEYAQLVLYVIAAGFVIGSCNGLISALVGGSAGYWWSFIFFLGLTFLFPGPIEFFWSPVLWFGAFGAMFPQYYLTQKPLRYEFEKPLRQWLSNSWLVEPNQLARISGILLPLLLVVGLEVFQTGPVFSENKNYVARIGTIATWQNSRRLVRNSYLRHYSPRSSCQSNLKQIMLGVMQYTQDYDEYYPPKLTDPSNGVMVALYPYLKSTQLFQCPAEFYYPQPIEFKSGDFTDYYFNSRLYGLNLANVTNATSTVGMGDGNTGAGEANSAYSLGGLPPSFPPATRHRNGANYSFMDGHVKWFGPAVISNVATPTGYSFVPQVQGK